MENTVYTIRPGDIEHINTEGLTPVKNKKDEYIAFFTYDARQFMFEAIYAINIKTEQNPITKKTIYRILDTYKDPLKTKEEPKPYISFYVQDLLENKSFYHYDEIFIDKELFNTETEMMNYLREKTRHHLFNVVKLYDDEGVLEIWKSQKILKTPNEWKKIEEYYYSDNRAWVEIVAL